MKTPLEVLQDCRKNLSTDMKDFDDQKQKALTELKLQLENELNTSLIESIERSPEKDRWFASIRLRKEYLTYFFNSHEFLNFVNKNVKIPEGFKEIQPKGIKHFTKYNIRDICCVFALDE